MKKVIYLIDGNKYSALMPSVADAINFKYEVEEDDDIEVDIIYFNEISADEILMDRDFEYSYKIEMIAEMLLPNAREYHKWYEQEQALKEIGFLR